MRSYFSAVTRDLRTIAILCCYNKGRKIGSKKTRMPFAGLKNCVPSSLYVSLKPIKPLKLFLKTSRNIFPIKLITVNGMTCVKLIITYKQSNNLRSAAHVLRRRCRWSCRVLSLAACSIVAAIG